MKELSPELIALLRYLLPGFVGRWVFHGLTAHKRTDAFERVVEALIFTAIVQGIMPPLHDLLIAIGAGLAPYVTVLPRWHEQYDFGYTLVVSFAVGILAAGFANNDFFHRWLRNRHVWLCRHSEAEKWSLKQWRWTKRTSLPSQWYSMFSTRGAWVVLQLDDDQRIYGWALEWPDHPDDGHFAMCNAEWLVGEERHKIENTEAILISVKNVKMIQFASMPDPMGRASASNIGRVKRMFSRLMNGNRSTKIAAAKFKQATPAIGTAIPVAIPVAIATIDEPADSGAPAKQVNGCVSNRKRRKREKRK